MLLVTGGAGFIGSNIVAALNDVGRADVVVSDVLGRDGKWHNLAKRQLADFVPPPELLDWLKGRKLDAVIHMGAISETTATDGDLVIETNFRFSLRLLARDNEQHQPEYGVPHGASCVSSAVRASARTSRACSTPARSAAGIARSNAACRFALLERQVRRSRHL